MTVIWIVVALSTGVVVLLMLLWVARKSLSRCLCLATEEDTKGNADHLEATLTAGSLLPAHIHPQLQSCLSTAHKASDSMDVAVAQVEEENRGNVSLAEMINRQGGQISNNALWNEPQLAHIAPAPAPAQPLQPLSVSSALTSRRWQPESDDSQSTRKGMLASASTGIHTLPLDSSVGQPQCACLKGRPTRFLNSSLAMKVSELQDLSLLPLALQPQYQPCTRNALGVSIERTVHFFKLPWPQSTAAPQLEPPAPVVQAAVGFLCGLKHPNVLPVLSHVCKPAARCNEDCPQCVEVVLESEICNGGTLADAVQQGLFCRSAVCEQWAIATSLLSDVAQGMHFLHSQGVVHGNLNLDNIHLQMDEGSHFSIGAAIAMGEASARLAGMLTSPMHSEAGDYGLWSGPTSQDFQNSTFLAPESEHSLQCSTALDIYSFGVLMWTLITGRPVHNSKYGLSSNSEQIAFPALPQAAPLTYTLLLKACLSPKPKDRPSFMHMQQIFTDMRKEMQHDHYVDSTGNVQMASRPLQSAGDRKSMDCKVPGGEMPAPTLVYDEPGCPAPREADSARVEHSCPTSPTSGAPSFSFPKLSGAAAAQYTDSSSAHTSDQLRPMPDLSRLTPAVSMNYASDHEASPSGSVLREGLLPKTSSFMLDLTMVDLERRSSRGSSANQSGSHSPHQVVLSPWNLSYDSCESASELLFPLKAAGAAGPNGAHAQASPARASETSPTKASQSSGSPHKRSTSPRWATIRPQDHFKDLRGSAEELQEEQPRLPDTLGGVGEDTATLAAQSQSMISSSASAPSIVVSSSSSQMPRADSGPTKDPLPKEPAPKESDIRQLGDAIGHPTPTQKPTGSSLPRRPRSLLVNTAHGASARGVLSDRGPKNTDVGARSRGTDFHDTLVRGPTSRSRSNRGVKTEASSHASVVTDLQPSLPGSTSSSRRGRHRSSSSNGDTTLRTPKSHTHGPKDVYAVPSSPNSLRYLHSGGSRSGGLPPMNSATQISHPRSADDSTSGSARSRLWHGRDTGTVLECRTDAVLEAGSRSRPTEPSTPCSARSKHRSTSSRKTAEPCVSTSPSAISRGGDSLSPAATGREGPRSKDKKRSRSKRKEKAADRESSGLPSRCKHEAADALKPKKRSSRSPRPHEGPSSAQSPRDVEYAAADILDGSHNPPEMVHRVTGKPQNALLQRQQRQKMHGLHDNQISNAVLSKRNRRHRQAADTSMSTTGAEHRAGVGVGSVLHRPDSCDSAAVLCQPAACDSETLEVSQPLEVSAEMPRQGSLSRPLSGESSKLSGSSRLVDMKGDSSSSTWRLSEAMLGPGGAASVVFLQSLEDVVSSLTPQPGASPANSTASIQKHSSRCGGVPVKGLVEPSKMPSIQE